MQEQVNPNDNSKNEGLGIEVYSEPSILCGMPGDDKSRSIEGGGCLGIAQVANFVIGSCIDFDSPVEPDPIAEKKRIAKERKLQTAREWKARNKVEQAAAYKAWSDKKKEEDPEWSSKRAKDWREGLSEEEKARVVRENTERCSEWYKENQEYSCIRNAQFYHENKEKSLAASKKWSEENRDRSNAIKNNWLVNNPEKRKEVSEIFYENNFHKINAKRKLPVEPLWVTDGLCEVCKNEESITKKRLDGKRSLAIDHCHESGVFRGWLCFRCNTILGKVDDDFEILERLIGYLKERTPKYIYQNIQTSEVVG